MNKTAVVAGLTASLAMLSMASTASALTDAGAIGQHGMRPGMGRGIVGEVASISGSTLSVDSRSFGKGSATTTYSVDASSATIFKDNATSSLASIAEGDTVLVQGTVSGTSVVAKTIRDGLPALGNGKWQGKPGGPRPNFPEIQGSGQPVIGGSISAISGNSLTVGTKAGTSYTVDASGATVFDKGATSSVADLAIGDQVIVQGSVNGSTVAASSIITGGASQGDASGAAQGRGPSGFLACSAAFSSASSDSSELSTRRHGVRFESGSMKVQLLASAHLHVARRSLRKGSRTGAFSHALL